MKSPRIDVIYAASMKPGDLYAGKLNPGAPTRPVQEFAAAHTIASAERFQADDGRLCVRFRSAAGFDLTPVPIGTQCLVIRL